jgi:hypothetical protein
MRHRFLWSRGRIEARQNSLSRAAVKRTQERGALWIVYPKGQSRITESTVILGGRAAGLKDVKVVSFSSTQTALKFVRPLKA